MPLLFIQGGQDDFSRKKDNSVTLSDALYLAKLHHEYEKASTPEEKRAIADKAIEIAREKFGDDLEVVEGKMNKAKEIIKLCEYGDTFRSGEVVRHSSLGKGIVVQQIEYDAVMVKWDDPSLGGKNKSMVHPQTLQKI